MKDFLKNINWMDCLFYVMTWIGFYFVNFILISYFNGFDEFKFVNDNFLVGKTIPEAYLKQVIAFAIGLIAIYLVHRYPYKNMTYKKYFAICYSLTLITFVIILLYLRFLPNKQRLSDLMFLLIFTASYFIIYGMYYLRESKEIEKVNQAIKKTGK